MYDQTYDLYLIIHKTVKEKFKKFGISISNSSLFKISYFLLETINLITILAKKI